MNKSKAIIASPIIPMRRKNNELRLLTGDCLDWFPKLDKKFKNKAKLIYLDPPYNTKRRGGARIHFSDSNEKWKELMEKVLTRSHLYLKKSGFLIMSINQMEIFNLKQIAENVFPGGFIGIFPIKVRHHNRQLMINATFHNVYEYLLIFRKDKKTRFYSSYASYNKEKFCYSIKILDDNPRKKKVGGKLIKIYKRKQFEILKQKPSPRKFRKYDISGKIATANWSGIVYEKHIKKLGENLLVKVYDLDKKGLGYRWFLTGNKMKKSGSYFQHTKSAGRPKLFTNYIDLTDIITGVYNEGGIGVDYKDSKKSEYLMDMLLNVTTKKNDLVLDFFAGSGTTLATCIKKNRSCVVIEKNKEPLKTIHTRMKNMQNGKDLDGIKYKFQIKTHRLN